MVALSESVSQGIVSTSELNAGPSHFCSRAPLLTGMGHRTRKIVSYCNHDPVYVELPNWTFQKLNQEPVRGSAGQSHGMVHTQCHRLS
ncbi:MAG: hypothetical protein QOG23_3544 [Blastocatellia bacterium]|nr:hypothetical protein [Blastocatellia bacterium]